MSLVRFFNNQTLVSGLVFDGIDSGQDLLKWLCGHQCSPAIEHLACIYRLYARFKFKFLVTSIEGKRIAKTRIRLKYDVFIKDNELLIKARDYVTGVRVKGTPFHLLNYLYVKN